jgi:1-acyl-sn-glycerol-3-phosphate acyltransferase
MNIASIAQRAAWIVGRPLFVFFLHFRVYGKENLRGLQNGIIFASNHTSEGDGILISGSFNLFSKRLPLYFIAREKDFYKNTLFHGILYTKWLFHAFGAYPAIVGIRDFEKSLSTHIELLRESKNIAIFPEGTRSRDGKLLGAKGGVVALAKAANKPIVPVVVSGILKITPKEFFQRKRFVTVRFGKPISPDELFAGYANPLPADYKKIADEKVMTAIAKILPKEK